MSHVTFTNNPNLTSNPSLSAKERHGKTFALYNKFVPVIDQKMQEIKQLNGQMKEASQQINNASTAKTTNATSFRKEYNEIKPYYYELLALITLVGKQLNEFNNIPILTEKQISAISYITPNKARSFMSSYKYRDQLVNSDDSYKLFRNYNQMKTNLETKEIDFQKSLRESKKLLTDLEYPRMPEFAKTLKLKVDEFGKNYKQTQKIETEQKLTKLKGDWNQIPIETTNPKQANTKNTACESAEEKHAQLDDTWDKLNKKTENTPLYLDHLKLRLDTEYGILDKGGRYDTKVLKSGYNQLNKYQKHLKELHHFIRDVNELENKISLEIPSETIAYYSPELNKEILKDIEQAQSNLETAIIWKNDANERAKTIKEKIETVQSLKTKIEEFNPRNKTTQNTN